MAYSTYLDKLKIPKVYFVGSTTDSGSKIRV